MLPKTECLIESGQITYVLGCLANQVDLPDPGIPINIEKISSSEFNNF